MFFGHRFWPDRFVEVLVPFAAPLRIAKRQQTGLGSESGVTMRDEFEAGKTGFTQSRKGRKGSKALRKRRKAVAHVRRLKGTQKA